MKTDEEWCKEWCAWAELSGREKRGLGLQPYGKRKIGLLCCKLRKLRPFIGTNAQPLKWEVWGPYCGGKWGYRFVGATGTTTMEGIGVSYFRLLTLVAVEWRKKKVNSGWAVDYVSNPCFLKWRQAWLKGKGEAEDGAARTLIKQKKKNTERERERERDRISSLQLKEEASPGCEEEKGTNEGRPVQAYSKRTRLKPTRKEKERLKKEWACWSPSRPCPKEK